LRFTFTACSYTADPLPMLRPQLRATAPRTLRPRAFSLPPTTSAHLPGFSTSIRKS
jgi:hypothetical protein